MTLQEIERDGGEASRKKTSYMVRTGAPRIVSSFAFSKATENHLRECALKRVRSRARAEGRDPGSAQQEFAQANPGKRWIEDLDVQENIKMKSKKPVDATLMYPDNENVRRVGRERHLRTMVNEFRCWTYL